MKARSILLLLMLLAVSVWTTGCGGGGGSAAQNPNDRGGGSGGTDWTVMVFLNADNDLEPYSLINVEQMQKIGSTDRVKVVVQWDRSTGYSTADGDWTGTRRYEVQKGSRKLLEDMGEVDMGDPQAMKDFISWAQTNYPARHYCLLIWNHGSGWRSATLQTCNVSRNISFDDSSGNSIRTRDLPGIVSSAPNPIELVSMDASLMQMVEVAYEMKGSTNLLVASEESPPGDGYVYDQWLGPLAANPSMDAFSLGKTIADSYVKAYTGQYAVTQSIVDLSRMSEVGTALDQFASALIPYAASQSAKLKDARESAQYYSYDDYKYKDLLDYAQKASQAIGSGSLNSAYTSLEAAVKQAVLYETHTGSAVQGSRGLSVWVPDPASYDMYATRYSALQLARDTSWDEFLAAQSQ